MEVRPAVALFHRGVFDSKARERERLWCWRRKYLSFRGQRVARGRARDPQRERERENGRRRERARGDSHGDTLCVKKLVLPESENTPWGARAEHTQNGIIPFGVCVREARRARASTISKMGPLACVRNSSVCVAFQTHTHTHTHTHTSLRRNDTVRTRLQYRVSFFPRICRYVSGLDSDDGECSGKPLDTCVLFEWSVMQMSRHSSTTHSQSSTESGPTQGCSRAWGPAEHSWATSFWAFQRSKYPTGPPTWASSSTPASGATLRVKATRVWCARFSHATSERTHDSGFPEQTSAVSNSSESLPFLLIMFLLLLLLLRGFFSSRSDRGRKKRCFFFGASFFVPPFIFPSRFPTPRPSVIVFSSDPKSRTRPSPRTSVGHHPRSESRRRAGSFFELRLFLRRRRHPRRRPLETQWTVGSSRRWRVPFARPKLFTHTDIALTSAQEGSAKNFYPEAQS